MKNKTERIAEAMKSAQIWYEDVRRFGYSECANTANALETLAYRVIFLEEKLRDCKCKP